MLDTHARKYVNPAIEKGADFFLGLKLKPNHVTMLALFIGIMTSVFAYFDMGILAVAVLWFSGYLDAVDGAMARKSGATSYFGTLMDIVSDRIVEAGIILVMALKFSDAGVSLVVLSLSILMSMTIFLTVGACTEKQGMKSFYYQAGVAERSEGFIMLSLMILFSSHVVIISYIFSAMILFTACQRFLEAKKILK